MTEELLTTMRTGFAQVVDAIGQTNLKIDRTNARLDTAVERLDRVEQRLDRVDQRLDQVDERLNQVVFRIDRLDQFVVQNAAETNTKLDGIGSYLKSINGSVLDHAKRIYKLEQKSRKESSG